MHLREFQPQLHSRFDLLNDRRLNNAQAALQFDNGNTADSLSVESARLQPARLMRNFKSRAAQSGGARDVTYHGAFVVETGDAQNQTRSRLLKHAKINQPQFPALGLRHDSSSSRSYKANISPDALIIC